MAKLNDTIKWPGAPGHQPSAAEFFRDVQRFLKNEVNAQLRQLEPVINSPLEKAAAQETIWRKQ